MRVAIYLRIWNVKKIWDVFLEISFCQKENTDRIRRFLDKILLIFVDWKTLFLVSSARDIKLIFNRAILKFQIDFKNRKILNEIYKQQQVLSTNDFI